MEVKFGWVNFSPSDLCKSVPMRNVSIPFLLWLCHKGNKTTGWCGSCQQPILQWWWERNGTAVWSD